MVATVVRPSIDVKRSADRIITIHDIPESGYFLYNAALWRKCDGLTIGNAIDQSTGRHATFTGHAVLPVSKVNITVE